MMDDYVHIYGWEGGGYEMGGWSLYGLLMHLLIELSAQIRDHFLSNGTFGSSAFQLQMQMFKKKFQNQELWTEKVGLAFMKKTWIKRCMFVTIKLNIQCDHQ